MKSLPKTWNISDDLGQIEYLFSDKTGTLTQNKMEFRKCSVGGISYGQGLEDFTTISNSVAFDSLLKSETLMRHTLSSIAFNPYLSSKSLPFIDSHIALDLSLRESPQSQRLNEFFLLLALCHTVLSPKSNVDDVLTYKAQSPDEFSLVTTAKDMGFVFLGKSQNRLETRILGQNQSFELLNLFEFNSTRKRMSVIVRTPKNQILLLSKGADNVIFDRLQTGQNDMKRETLLHLDSFANEGEVKDLCWHEGRRKGEGGWRWEV